MPNGLRLEPTAYLEELALVQINKYDHSSVGLEVCFYTSADICRGGCSLAMTVDGTLHPILKWEKGFLKFCFVLF